jgi:hypothetical protein
MDAEEKEAQITKQVVDVEGIPLTAEDEFKIIIGKGIEFKAGELTLYVKPMMIQDYDMLYEIEDVYQNKTLSISQKVKKIIEMLAPVLGVELSELKKNLDLNDVVNVVKLLSYSMLHGRRIFEKKNVKARELL